MFLLTGAFKLFDKDGDGFLDAHEIKFITPIRLSNVVGDEEESEQQRVKALYHRFKNNLSNSSLVKRRKRKSKRTNVNIEK
jgi:Ca2+-binding EF-hand superfamily protein